MLILVRDLASKLATPMFLADGDGKIGFYNEAAERILGRRFSEGFTVSPADWIELLKPTDTEGRPLGLTETPVGAALKERRPDHRRVRIQGLDGVSRTVSATGIPLLTSADHFVGLLAVFWEEQEQDASA